MLGLGLGLRTPVPNIPGAQLCSELTIVESVTLLTTAIIVVACAIPMTSHGHHLGYFNLC